MSAVQKSIAVFPGACTPRSSIQKRTAALEHASLCSVAPADPGSPPLPLAGEAVACCKMTLVGGLPLAEVTAVSISGGSKMVALSAFPEVLKPEETDL